jgi:hypothetical protein
MADAVLYPRGDAFWLTGITYFAFLMSNSIISPFGVFRTLFFDLSIGHGETSHRSRCDSSFPQVFTIILHTADCYLG